jgi:hypothetical protein
MSLKAPNLDDRDFNQLVEEALRRVGETSPQWTDLSPHDPGIVLLELFAFLTETMIYRLNRLPEKAYIEFLRLLGVKLSPPIAASVRLRFSLSKVQKTSVIIERGTRVTLNRTNSDQETPIFTTLGTAVIEAGKTEIEVMAYHCELVEAELIGTGTGLASLYVTAKRPPIVAATEKDLELIIGIETREDELQERPRTIAYDGKPFRIWREVESFSNLGERELVYIVDRTTGIITFAPALQLSSKNGQLADVPTALAEKPMAGREIRAWYCRGGGAAGNVSENTLTVLKTQIPGVSVTNPEAATGGRDVESLPNALLRAPQEFHSLQRAVTANDFELLALKSSGAVARAKAFTKAMLWRHAQPGTIEVLLVPEVPKEKRAGGERISIEDLQNQATEEARQSVRRALDERRPLGTTCLVNWVHYKEVSVKARVIAHRGADLESVKSRVLKRLHQSINPLPSEVSAGWGFGQPLRASHVYDIVLSEKDVSYVENVTFQVDEVPEADLKRNSLAADAFQPHTWYAAVDSNLFRSMDDGDGWELIRRFPDETIFSIQTNRNKAGMIAVATKFGESSSRLYISSDCGETWRMSAEMNFTINEIAWAVRDNVPLVYLATDDGLYELWLQASASPLQIRVDPADPKLGFYAVTASVGARGTYYVAVAARNLGGVFLSTQGGKSESFTNIGLSGDDVRVLEIQQDGVQTFLWAGITVAGGEAGKGCVRWELQGATPPTNSSSFERSWDGGSCHGVTFNDSYAFAATHDNGVLWIYL